jgi:ADP-ribose pyrophosphatase YjhB (NUDIX family)
MNFEPQKFFIGVIDFFSILLPGALFTYLLKDDVGPRFFGNGYHRLTGTEGWVVFLFSSYLLGHFIFLLGSWLLDDHVYDRIREATHEGQIKRLAKGKKLSSALARWLAASFIKRGSDQAVSQAVRTKEHYLDPLSASDAINAFQWCKAKLTLEHPEGLATVQRFEADSKFFRSFVIVLCVLIPWGLFVRRPGITLFGAISLVLAFWRYVDQRVKATNQAYWYILTLEASRGGALQQLSQPQADGPSHAGGVAFRQAGGQVKYLLVQAKHAPKEWVLPKGHIERGERMQETAVREVHEETGVWARIKTELNKVSFTVNGEAVKVQFYLMEAVQEGKSSDRRSHIWLPLDEAVHRATHDETIDLMRLAEQKRTTT